MKNKTKPPGILGMLMTLVVMAIAVAIPITTTSCETFKETVGSLGVSERIKEAAKEWIAKKLDEALPSGKEIVPVIDDITDSAELLDEVALRDEILSQLKEKRKAAEELSSP